MTTNTFHARELLAKPRFSVFMPAVIHGVPSVLIIRGAWLADGTAEGLIFIMPAAEGEDCKAAGLFSFDPETGLTSQPVEIGDDAAAEAFRACYGGTVGEIIQPTFRQLCDLLADVVEARSPGIGDDKAAPADRAAMTVH